MYLRIDVCIVQHESGPMGPCLVTDLDDTANAKKRGDREVSISSKGSGAQGGAGSGLTSAKKLRVHFA